MFYHLLVMRVLESMPSKAAHNSKVSTPEPLVLKGFGASTVVFKS